jgi:hypothetical protein
LYRANANAAWTVVEDAVLNMQGSPTDGNGRFVVSNIQKGEYTFGFKYSSLRVEENLNAPFVLYPNPSNSTVKVDLPPMHSDNVSFTVFNSAGALCLSEMLPTDQTIELSNWTPGIYVVQFSQNGEFIGWGRLTVE